MGLEQLQNGLQNELQNRLQNGCKTSCKTVAKRLQNGCKTVAVIARFGRPNAANPDTLYSQSTTVKKNTLVAIIGVFHSPIRLALSTVFNVSTMPGR